MSVYLFTQSTFFDVLPIVTLQMALASTKNMVADFSKCPNFTNYSRPEPQHKCTNMCHHSAVRRQANPKQ